MGNSSNDNKTVNYMDLNNLELYNQHTISYVKKLINKSSSDSSTDSKDYADKKISDLENKLNDKVSDLDTKVDSNKTTTDKKISDLDTKISNELSDLSTKTDSNKNDIDKKLSDLDNKMTNKVSDLDTRLSDELSDLDTKVDNNKNTTDKKISDLDNKVDSNKTDIDKSISDLDTKTTDEISKLDTKLNNKLSDLGTKVDNNKIDTDNKLSDLDAEITNNKTTSDNRILDLETIVDNNKTATDKNIFDLNTKVDTNKTDTNNKLSDLSSTVKSIKDCIGDIDKISDIKYYATYHEFKTDYDAGNIDEETLILIGEEVDNLYMVQIIPADNMARDSNSGSLKQHVVNGKITDVSFNADTGYYFPTNYSVSSVNGISVTRNNESKITISGKPTKDTTITLVAPTKNQPTKAEQSAPTGLSDGVDKINGTTSLMEYSTDNTNWITCNDSSTVVEAGTYYIRYKETDTLKASPSITIEVTSGNASSSTPNAITDLKAVRNSSGKLDVSFTFPKNASYVKVFASNTYAEYDNGDKAKDNNTDAVTLTYPNNTCTFSTTQGGFLSEFEGVYITAYAFNANDESSEVSNVVQYITNCNNGCNGGYEGEGGNLKRLYLFKEGDTCDSITNGWECSDKSLGGVSSKYMYIKPTVPCSAQTVYLYTKTGQIKGTGSWQTDEANWLLKIINKLSYKELFVEYSLRVNGVSFKSLLSSASSTDNYASVGSYSCYYNSTSSPKLAATNIARYLFNPIANCDAENNKIYNRTITPVRSDFTLISGTDLAIVLNLGTTIPANADIELRIYNVFMLYQDTSNS